MTSDNNSLQEVHKHRRGPSLEITSAINCDYYSYVSYMIESHHDININIKLNTKYGYS